ncbi:MAG TPA: hypothetical protein VIJ45_00335, partial [Coriobacteriia bacterium]
MGIADIENLLPVFAPEARSSVRRARSLSGILETTTEGRNRMKALWLEDQRLSVRDVPVPVPAAGE